MNKMSMPSNSIYYKSIALCLFLPHCTFFQKEPSIQEKITHLYENISGFGISAQDEQLIRGQGCDATYGEITFQGVELLVKKIPFTAQDVFYDLGCGVGKMVIQIFLMTPVKKSIGIELSTERADKAHIVLNQLNIDNETQKGRILEFRQESFLETNLDDATIIYLASTCFSSELMGKITEKLATLKAGLKVVTLKKLTESANFKLVDEFILPMTWSDATKAYLYELSK